MKVGIYQGRDELIIAPLDENEDPYDPDGTLFGEKSGRDITDYDMEVDDFTQETSIHIRFIMHSLCKAEDRSYATT